MIEIGLSKVPDVRRWTYEAYLCYERHGVCAGCINKSIMETPCQMKLTVIALVREFGVPKRDKNGNFIYEGGNDDETV